MTDIKDKLEQLKRERKIRSKAKKSFESAKQDEKVDQAEGIQVEEVVEQRDRKKKDTLRSERIKKSWEEIDRDKEVSTKKKLERLITLTREKKEEKEPEHIPFEPIEREPLQFFENPYPLDTKYGKVTLSKGVDIKGEILSFLSKDPSFTSLDLSTAVFVDLETTGLSGGSGIVPFLVGLGYYQDEKFYVTQYFLGDLAEEEQMIEELSQFLSGMDFQSVVTFNGKAFDMPLLETLFVINRSPFTLSELPHLDFLFSARSLWRHKLESCRLFHLAREIVQADRAEDIPSSEVPYLYFQYLKTGNFELMEPVLYHNQEDILSLLGLVITGSMFFSDEESEWIEDSLDLFGVGKVLENIGDVEKSMQYYKKALEGNLTNELALLVKKKLSYYFKRNDDWDRAVSIWKELSSLDQLFSFRELSMYYEHRVKKFEEAERIAEEGLALSMDEMSTYFQYDFSYRLERLRRKIKRRKEKTKK